MIRVVQGDLLVQPVECIVNPANGFLRHGGGLARIIHDRATKNAGAAAHHRASRWWAENKGVPTIATGDVHVTCAGNLPFKGVIHTVGPVWKDGSLCEKALLRAAHDNALAAAVQRGWRSIGFPAVSCGLFRFPVQFAAPIALESARAFQGQFDNITFALFEDDHYAAYREASVRVLAP